ncbi:MAG TPA: hypothetical protein VM598_02140 [Bdellovibrionota bacterium]|nr:hypothetical protein [Bdellovibrionota bacterium]
MRKHTWVLLLLLAQGCSFSPSGKAPLTIVLKPREQDLYRRLTQPLAAFLVPTQVSDFNCFGVNVTGPGLADLGNIKDCTTSDNMHGRGVGIVSDKLVTYGGSLSMQVPAGPDRTISVFGIDPPGGDCGGSSSGGTQYGYFLGETTRPIFGPTAVTIPISFTAGATASLACTDGGGGNTQTIDGSSNRGWFSGACADPGAIAISAPGAQAPGLFSAPEHFSASAEDGNFAAHECSGGPMFDIVVQEYAFSIDLSGTSYSQVSIRWKGAAGYYGGGCMGSVPSGSTTGGAFPRLDIFNSMSGLWESLGTPSTAVGILTATKSPVADYVYSNEVRLRVVGGRSGTSNCSRVETDYVAATFE